MVKLLLLAVISFVFVVSPATAAATSPPTSSSSSTNSSSVSTGNSTTSNASSTIITTQAPTYTCKKFSCDGEGCSLNASKTATTCVATKCAITKFDNITDITVEAKCDQNCTNAFSGSGTTSTYCCTSNNCNGNEYDVPVQATAMMRAGASVWTASIVDVLLVLLIAYNC